MNVKSYYGKVNTQGEYIFEVYMDDGSIWEVDTTLTQWKQIIPSREQMNKAFHENNL